MRRKLLLLTITASLVFTTVVSSCSGGVSQQQYDTLYNEVNTLRGKKAEVSMYILFLDILMYQFYKRSNVPTKYDFATYDEWTQSLTKTASSMNDAQLTVLLNKMIKDPNAIMELTSYVIQHIEDTAQ